MSDEALRDRIAVLLYRNRDGSACELAQAIIDEFGLTMRGDGCGYHEIYGSYDTRFGKWEQQ